MFRWFWSTFAGFAIRTYHCPGAKSHSEAVVFEVGLSLIRSPNSLNRHAVGLFWIFRLHHPVLDFLGMGLSFLLSMSESKPLATL